MSDYDKRRAFLRFFSLSTLAAGAVTLFDKAIKSEEDCIGDGKCKKCLSLKKCELPLAQEHKEKKKALNGKFAQTSQSLKGVKGSLAYKRDLIRNRRPQNG
ncbi:MAG: hypothetical protein HQL32_09270 [Planctomycetes bacterium]|nr:hypothetical protein [Planctomycetota bacterium]